MHPHVCVNTGAENILSDVSRSSGFIDGLLQNPRAQDHFSADIDVSRFCANGIAGQQDAFQDLVRIALHQLSVLERAGLALVGVTTEVSGTLVIFGEEAPLHPGREAGATASAEA